jgi:rSAM/selenodomain-associated transferase 1
VTRRSVVYVVAKAPRPGACKTRLCPPLTPAQAAQLAGAFLADAVAVIVAAGLAPRVVCRDAEEQALLNALVGDVAEVRVQQGCGLGDALEGAFREGLADGFNAVGVLGADSPTLAPAVLRHGFAALAAGADVAFGPSEDGGYYLLAASAVHPPLFRDMVWITDQVAAETLRRCRALDLRVHHLPTWYDVDEAASLDRLRADLRQTPPTLAPRTRTTLARMAPQLTARIA